MQSNVAAGLGLALKSADVLVTVALTGLGWAVSKRFDTTDSNLREVKSILEQLQQRVGR